MTTQTMTAAVLPPSKAVTFDQLWHFAKVVAAELTVAKSMAKSTANRLTINSASAHSTDTQTYPTPESVFQSIGLRLERPERCWTYYCTPRNAKTFASTGRDGVHYSFLVSKELRHSPIVMTVPMSFETPNIVIAETLHEFLCLGCRTSYLLLESLTMDENDFHPLTLKGYSAQLSQEQRYHLQRLTQRFSLAPYVALRQRIACLQTKYIDYLQMGEVERTSKKTAMQKTAMPAAFTFGQFLRS